MKKRLLTFLTIGGLATVGVAATILFVKPMFAGQNDRATSDSVTSTASNSLPFPIFAPSWIPVGISSEITVTVPVANSSIIATSVNLIKLGPNGSTTIVGLLHDDGLNGDLVAGDGIYSIRIPLLSAVGGPIEFEISAAVRGALKRILSPVFTIGVYTNPPPLPPDPGTAGMQTLNGIDSDGDGVRDDVQRYIAATYSTSTETQSAVTQLAKVILSMIANATNTTLAHAFVLQQGYALECLSAATSTDTSILDSLENQIENTPPRMSAYLEAEGQAEQALSDQMFFYKLSSNPQARCLVP